MGKLVSPMKVGLVTIGGIIAIFVMQQTFVRERLAASETYRVYAFFEDVSGLVLGSKVLMAGIRVGEIEAIELWGIKARVSLRIRDDVELHTDASVAIKTYTILGDNLLELTPGSPEAPLLPDGGEIKNVYQGSGVDAVFEQLETVSADVGRVTKAAADLISGGAIDTVVKQLEAITNDVKAITGVVKDLIGAEEMTGGLKSIVRDAASITRQVDSTLARTRQQIDTIGTNIEQFSEQLTGMGGDAKAQVEVIMAGMTDVSSKLQTLVDDVRAVVGSSESDLHQSVEGILGTIRKLDSSLDEFTGLLRDVRGGQGTVGRLVTDSKLMDDLEATVDDVREFAKPITSLQTHVDLRTEVHVGGTDEASGGHGVSYRGPSAKASFGLRLQPRDERYYLVELVSDPRGTIEETEVLGGPTTRTRDLSAVRYGVQYGWRYDHIDLRVGIIESSGGVGANLRLLDDRLDFRVDLYNFGFVDFGGNATWPRLRTVLNWEPIPTLYFTAGVEDPFNRNALDYFFGAGLRFTDQDLRSILTATGIPALP